MEWIDDVKAYASKYVKLDDRELAFFIGMFELRRFEKRKMLITEGEVEKHLNFVIKGLAIKFFRGKKDRVVTQLARENDLISCYDSFLSGRPSNSAVETLEPTTVVSLTKENVDRLYDYSPKMERLGRMITTDQFLRWVEFEYDRLRLSSSDRFVNFVRGNADLMQRVPQKYLASYLNMKPETFSRLKHLIKRPL